MKREIRFLVGAELRATGNHIEAYAAVFNQPSEDLGGFRETIKPGAFTRCLGSNPDVRCLFNHNASLVLGRTKAGTLRVSEDSTGLLFDCDLPSTGAGRDVGISIRRGDVSQCSFGFVCLADAWSGNGARRELIDVDLLDVSPVTYPAYPETSVSARALWPDGIPVEVASHRTGTATGGYVFRVALPAVDAALETERRRALLRLASLQG